MSNFVVMRHNYRKYAMQKFVVVMYCCRKKVCRC